MDINAKVCEQQPEITQPKLTNEISRGVCVQPYQTTQPKKWKRGLFSCCDDGVSWDLCKPFVCPCIVYGELAQQIGYGNCCWCGFLYGILCTAAYWFTPTFGFFLNLSCIVHTGLRKRIREKSGLPSNTCNDFLVTWLCSCCALSQEVFEMKPSITN